MTPLTESLNAFLQRTTGITYLSDVELEPEDLKICKNCGHPEDDHEKGWRCPAEPSRYSDNR